VARVYRSLVGLDDYVGRVEENGRVYGQRVGPDERLGRVEENGRIYVTEPGADRYLGRVEVDGTIYRHVAGGADVNVGRVGRSGKVYVRRPGTAPDAFDGVHMKGEYLADGSGAWRKPYSRCYVGGGTGVFAPISPHAFHVVDRPKSLRQHALHRYL